MEKDITKCPWCKTPLPDFEEISTEFDGETVSGKLCKNCGTVVVWDGFIPSFAPVIESTEKNIDNWKI